MEETISVAAGREREVTAEDRYCLCLPHYPQSSATITSRVIIARKADSTRHRNNNKEK